MYMYVPSSMRFMHVNGKLFLLKAFKTFKLKKLIVIPDNMMYLPTYTNTDHL